MPQDEGKPEPNDGANSSAADPSRAGILPLPSLRESLTWASRILARTVTNADSISEEEFKTLWGAYENLIKEHDRLLAMLLKINADPSLHRVIEYGVPAERIGTRSQAAGISLAKRIPPRRKPIPNARWIRRIYQGAKFLETRLTLLDRVIVYKKTSSSPSQPSSRGGAEQGKPLRGVKEICSALGVKVRSWRWLKELSRQTNGPLHAGKAGKKDLLFTVPLMAWFASATDMRKRNPLDESAHVAPVLGKETKIGTSSRSSLIVSEDSSSQPFPVKARRADLGKKRKPRQT